MTPRTRPSEATFPALEGAAHHFVDLPGLRMHVAEAGSGEPVVLLHESLRQWWEWRDVISGLAKHYRVICPDLRGEGWTEAPPRGYTRNQLLTDLVSQLNLLELDRVRLISPAMSCIGGYALCLDHRERVERQIALGVPPPMIKFNMRFLPAMKHLWWQQVLAIPGLGPLFVSENHQRLPRYVFSHFEYDRASWSAEDVDTYLTRLREPDRARAASALYRHLVLPEVWRMMRGDYRRTRLQTPTLVLFGTANPAFPPELVNLLLRDREAYADHLEVAFVDRAAHYIAEERPDAVIDHALKFFAAPSG
jgi:pimeloyl-ACP methyl ester carboxylesterase